MVEIWAIAGAWAAGVDSRRIGVLAAAVLVPVPTSLLIVYAIWRGRRQEASKAVAFCMAAASEMRAGSSVLRALEVSSRSAGIPPAAALAAEGAPLQEVVRAIGEHLPEIGPELAAALGPAQRGGARVADLFDEIASLAIAQADIAAEVKMATAPVRATVAVLALAPLLYLAWRGGIPANEVPGQSVVSLVGAILFLIGLSAVVLITRRGS
jgi:hypothetical protein